MTDSTTKAVAAPQRRGLLWWMPPAWAAWIYTVLLRPAPLRALAQKAICRFIPEQIEISGVMLSLNRHDAIVSGNLALGCYETYNVELFERLLTPGMCVLDVGANIGLYSAIAARKVGTRGMVVAVEPDPTNVSFLRRTKDRNGLTNLTIIEKAAGDSTGPSYLYLCKTNKADHRTYGGDESRESIRIEMITLDSVVNDLQMPHVDVLKVDTQGFEYFVAHGMLQILERNRRLRIFMEFWPWGITRAGGSPADLLEFFSSRGFGISLIDDTERELVRLDTFERLLDLTLERQHADLYLERLAT